MESEKVKEIKKALEDNANYEHHDKLGYIDGYKCKTVSYADILTLINELESENKRLLEQRNKTYNIWVKDTEQLKDRIAELEKEIKENAFYSKGYAQGIKNTYEVVVPDKLKQFAERLKEKFYYVFGNEYEQSVSGFDTKVLIEYIDETLKEYVK